MDTDLDHLHGVSLQRAARYATASGLGQRFAPSSLPAGAAEFSLFTATEAVLILDGPYEFAQIKLVSQFGPDPDAVERDLMSRSSRLVEPSTRTLLARVVASRLEASDDLGIGSNRVPRHTSKFSEREFLDLDEWAAARGWAVSGPDAVPSVTLTKDGRTVLLPLAAMQAKVDGEWRELGDVVAEKEGRWLVPATLDDLAR
ncbi:MAG: hypothetical protein IT207_04670 [Fimbriimonadaceae bacterium]|nr:hypothetical protein [Fimbriimonadaceae bacterium]